MRQKVFLAFIIVFILLVTILSWRILADPEYAASIRGQSTIAVININGELTGDNSGGSWSGTTTNSMTIMEILHQAAQRQDIKALVIRINSPGGASVACQEVSIELDKLRQKDKKVVVSMGDVCASAGYWIACNSDHIVANSTTLTGSIGVIMQLSNLEGLYDKLGIESEVIKSGLHKDMGSSTRPMTANERSILQSIVDDSYNQFVDHVYKNRQDKIDRTTLLEIADGRVLSGQQAQDLGLDDSLDNYYDALDIARELTGLGQDATIEVLDAQSWFNPFKLLSQIKLPLLDTEQNQVLKY